MKLRKKQIKLRKNFPVPPWRISIFYRGIFDFLRGVGSRSSECIGTIRGIGGIRRVTAVGRHDLCVRCVKGYSVVVLTGTDAQIVRPYKGYSS